MTLLNRHRELVAKLKSVRYPHVVREYNAAADSLAGEALESKVSKVVLNDHRKTELKEPNRIQEMIYEPSSDDIKVKNTSSGTFVQILDGKTRYIHATTSDILQQLQEERRRRIAQAQDDELRWSNLKAVLRGETTAMTYNKWADNFVLSSANVLYYTGVSRRKVEENLPEMSLRLVVPTTMIQERVKHDYYWISLYADVEKHVKSCLDCSSSKSLPQLKGYSPGSVLAERPFQVNTDVLAVAKVFEECIYRRFGAPSLIRHDRDPRFMSEVFQAFAELIQARSRAILCYRPQANGLQEQSVKTVMQSVTVYVEDPLQQDWDEIAERLVFWYDQERDIILFGTWMGCPYDTTSNGIGKQTEALAWRREINHQLQIALEMAKEYQAVEKARRARIHNEKLSRKEQTAIPKGVNDGSSDDDSEPRVKRKVEELAYELGLPDKSGYRFNPVGARFDFEELLPEDSWKPDEAAGEFEVEAILSDRTPMSTSTDRPVREFEVKWVGYESTTWEPASNLSCGGLLYDN
ncbi:reverse transcriptase [Phytophthora megakarya]|uniref:Reverse transcriptase n=1 Tax=Phytophthora megakarya TaxID=4795 RepID=A0A225VQ06_9STRA|nr:reverse transcriptase [Phytophthora megakarya]